MAIPARSFSLVDQILRTEDENRLLGRFRVPSTLEAFPASLLAEAVGQLAAWGAMSRLAFAWRPVAGLCSRIEVLGQARPGDELELEVTLESLDEDAVAYSGLARASHGERRPLLRLAHAVGPMMSLADFEDPEQVKARHADLSSAEPAPGGCVLPGGPLFERTAGESGDVARAILRVPKSADFFQDHFPRRAVFPGTLLMQAKLELACDLACELACKSGREVSEGKAVWIPEVITNMKLRSFSAPGDELLLEARRLRFLDEESSTAPAVRMQVALESRNAKRLVGAAEVTLRREALR